MSDDLDIVDTGGDTRPANPSQGTLSNVDSNQSGQTPLPDRTTVVACVGTGTLLTALFLTLFL